MQDLQLNDEPIWDLVKKTGLAFHAVAHLVDRGWVFREGEGGEAGIWVSPSAGLPPAHVEHHEPRCEDKCLNLAPHVHGLRCRQSCPECHGVCHPECPAYKEPANGQR